MVPVSSKVTDPAESKVEVVSSFEDGASDNIAIGPSILMVALYFTATFSPQECQVVLPNEAAYVCPPASCGYSTIREIRSWSPDFESVDRRLRYSVSLLDYWAYGLQRWLFQIGSRVFAVRGVTSPAVPVVICIPFRVRLGRIMRGKHNHVGADCRG